MQVFKFKNITERVPGISLQTVDKYSLLMHCIKIKSPAKSLLNEQYVFVGGNIFSLCAIMYFRRGIVNLIMNQLVCKTKGNLKRPDEGGVFLKPLL